MTPKPIFGQSLTYRALLSTLYDSDFPTLKPQEISDLSDYQVLDTREKSEYEVSHLKDAKWVGFESFELHSLDGLDRNQPVLVYCTVGARSQEIGKKLKDAGFSQVYNLYGGIIHWANEGRPLYQNGSLTDRVHTYSMTWGIWLQKGQKVYD